MPLLNGLDSNLAVSEVREVSTTDKNGEVIPLPPEEDEIQLVQEDSPMEVEEKSKEPVLLAARCCEYIPKSHRKSESPPVVIHHITLPIESGSTDSVLLDHDYNSTIVTMHSSQPSHTPSLSRESSAAVSDVSKVKSESSQTQVLTTNLDKCLHLAVRSIPLYGRSSPNEGFLLSAVTLGQFQSWAVGRRRASEWMRAVAVKQQVARQLRIPAVLTTKQVRPLVFHYCVSVVANDVAFVTLG